MLENSLHRVVLVRPIGIVEAPTLSEPQVPIAREAELNVGIGAARKQGIAASINHVPLSIEESPNAHQMTKPTNTPDPNVGRPRFAFDVEPVLLPRK